MIAASGVFRRSAKKMTTVAALLVLFAPLALSGCSPVGLAVGAGAATATAAQKEKGLETSWDDAQTELAIKKKFLEVDDDIFWDVSTEVQEGRVLLTGSVETVEDRLEAIKTVWQIEDVREVINEIAVGDEDTAQDYARDAWITTQIETKLLFDKDVSSIDYSIETVDQVVYLMGVARSHEELGRAIGHAKEIAYVRRVVSYVRVLEAEPAKTPAAGS
jgi:osmotically-inducible protein OsmY